MLIRIEKNEFRFIARFWLAYVLAGLLTMVFVTAGHGIPGAVFYFLLSAFVCTVFEFSIWLTVIYYRAFHGIEYIGIRYFWPYYGFMVMSLCYSALLLTCMSVIHRYGAMLAGVMILLLPMVYCILRILEGPVELEVMNSRGELKGKELPRKYRLQFCFHAGLMVVLGVLMWVCYHFFK